MNNINKYNTSIDYQTAKLTSHTRPSLSYAADIDYIYYDSNLNNETTDKRLSRVGDWVLSKADGSKLFVGDEVYNSKYKNDSTWTAIAKVVIPYDTFGDKTVRCRSLNFMSTSNPSQGSSNQVNMTFSCGAPTGTNYAANLHIIVDGTSTIGTAASAIQPTPSRKDVKSSNPRSFYLKNTGYSYFISMYNKDVVSDFVKHLAIEYINGKYNTLKIADHIVASNGSCPPVECCLAYTTVGTNAGDWYLPSIYELAFVVENGIGELAYYMNWSSTYKNSNTIWETCNANGVNVFGADSTSYSTGCIAFIQL